MAKNSLDRVFRIQFHGVLCRSVKLCEADPVRTGWLRAKVNDFEEMPVYSTHWGLHESPYRDGLDTRFFFPGVVHSEALARLHYLVDHRRHVGLLLGGAGTGKSLLLEVFAQDLRRAGHAVARVDLAGSNPRELLWQIAVAWGTSPAATDQFALWRAVSDRILENRWRQNLAVLLLDNFDAADDGLLTQVLRVVQCDPAAEFPVTTVLAARRLPRSAAARRLLDLAALRIDLEPWDQSETIAYLSTSLARAGRRQPLFDETALARLHQLAGGVPRHVNQLADLALLAGAGQQLAEIDAHTIESVYYELSTAEFPSSDAPTAGQFCV